MPICIQRNADGTYRVHHRPVEAKQDRYKWLNGPVFRTVKGSRRLYYLQFGLGDGPWIIMWRDYLTGKGCRARNTGEWDSYIEAEDALRALANTQGWHEVISGVSADFID